MSQNGQSAKKNIVWIDLEMTGLEPDRDHIMEIATIITDYELEIVAEGPELIIHQDESRFASMDEWNRRQHTQSGLWQKAVQSKVSIDDAEQLTLEFLRSHLAEKSAPLAGNTIWQDRRFLCKQMPKLESFLHYRTIDVSSLKMLINQWYPSTFHYTGKKDAHRALDDIRESILELRYYRNVFFKVYDQLVPQKV